MSGPRFFNWGYAFDWTEERCKKLAELWQAGMSGQEIADHFGNGLSRSAVIGKVHRLKLPKRGDEERRLKSRAKARREGLRRHKATTAQRLGLGQAAHIAPPAAKRLDPLPLPPPEPEPASTVTLEALTSADMCRWVYEHDGRTTFCGCKTVPNTSWCPTHHARVFRKFDIVPKRESPVRQVTFYDMEREDA